MEPEGSLLHSQVPATCPYPEPAQSSPYPTSHFLKIHLNIILSSVPGSPQWSLSLRFPHQNPVYSSPLLHTRYISRPFYSARFYHPSKIVRTVQIIKFLIMYFSPLTGYLVALRPKYSSQHPILKQSQPKFLPQCERPRFTSTKKKTADKIILFQYLDCVSFTFNSRVEPVYNNIDLYDTVYNARYCDID